MPPVELGDTVLWYAAPGVEPSAAIVSRLGHENVCLNVIACNNGGFMLRDGVRHVSDPNTNPAANENGRWDYTPREKRLMDLIGDSVSVTTTDRK